MRTHTELLYRVLTHCMMVGQELCGQQCCLLTELSLGLLSSLLSKAYCLECTAFCVFPGLLLYIFLTSFFSFISCTTLNGLMCIPRSSPLLSSLPFLSFSSFPFYAKYLLGLKLIKYHFVKSCFYLSKMALRLKLFYCVRSQKNIKKNPF